MGNTEKVNSQPTQLKEAEGQETMGQSLAPPAFQLKASPVQRKDGDQGGGDLDAGGVPKEFLDHLKLREGWRTKVYLDSEGLPTVGLGHLLTASEKQKYPVGTEVPTSLLNTWANADAQKAYDAAKGQASTLGVSSESFIIALASVNFQLGTSWNTKFKKTWGYMTKGEWEKAALEAQDSAWYAQTPVRVQDFQAALRALAGTSTTKPAEPEQKSSTTYDFKIGAPTGNGSTTADSLNVRRGPGTQYDKTGKKLSKGTSITVYGEVQGWLCIGQGEWVSKDFVSTATAKKDGAPTKEAPKNAGPNVKEIASAVWEAMFGGYTGLGTDEDAVYRNLAKLNHDGALIAEFKKAYKALHGGDIVADIKAEFSNSMIFGNQLDKALGYLNASGGAAAKAPAASEGAGKGAAQKPKAQDQKPKGQTPKSNWDIDKAVQALNANANDSSLGKCAKYVRMAINAGGVATPGNPVSAKDYKGYLEKFGFKQISTASYQKGDIAVFEAFQGDKKYHEHGHIQMYNGAQWVSDFKQRDFWAGGDYRKHKPGHVIYRM
ncbi:MAG: peptidoglycan amidohydrolase family protein [Bacteroidia bacterium]